MYSSINIFAQITIAKNQANTKKKITGLSSTTMCMTKQFHGCFFSSNMKEYYSLDRKATSKHLKSDYNASQLQRNTFFHLLNNIYKIIIIKK